jgi:hypothetical protein
MCNFKGRRSDTQNIVIFVQISVIRILIVGLYAQVMVAYMKGERWVMGGSWKLRGEERF